MISSTPPTPETATAAESLLAAPTGHEHIALFGEIITIVLSRAQTGESLTVMEVRTPPGGGLPVLHTHPGAKTLVVLEGTYELYGRTRGEKVTLTGCVGTTVHVPSEAPHGYANVGGTPGRMLALLHGETPMEDFLREVGTPIDDPSPPSSPGPPLSIERLRAAMRPYGMTIVEDVA